jgi:predicted nucleic acid-binding Zn ribbon protein
MDIYNYLCRSCGAMFDVATPVLLAQFKYGPYYVDQCPECLSINVERLRGRGGHEKIREDRH